VKLFRKRKKQTSRELIGVSTLTDYGMKMHNHGEIVFFIIKPHNLAVLSSEAIMYRLHALATVLKNVDEVEICCQNSRESFEDNKAYLKELQALESINTVRDLHEKDIEFLDKIQISMATAREFTVALRFRTQKHNEISNAVQRFEKHLKEQGFDARCATKEDIQRMLAVYFEQNTTQAKFFNFDGEQFSANIIERGEFSEIIQEKAS
jgi:hypothetical protein